MFLCIWLWCHINQDSLWPSPLCPSVVYSSVATEKMGHIESIYKYKMNNTQWHFTAFLQCVLRFKHPFFIMWREMEREAQDLQTFCRWLRMKDVGPICRDIVFRSGLCSKRWCSPLTRPGIWWLLMCEHVLLLNLSKPHWSYSLWGTRMQEPYTHPPHAPLFFSPPILPLRLPSLLAGRTAEFSSFAVVFPDLPTAATFMCWILQKPPLQHRRLPLFP